MEKNTVIGKNQWSVVRQRGGRWFDETMITDRSEIRNPKSKIEAGFSLFELMITMFIMIILLSIALPAYQRTMQHARETVLKENLWQMRRAIDQFTTDKGKLPSSLEDLVKERYLQEMPVDPITEKSTWNAILGEDKTSPDGGQGLVNVKSLADGTDSDDKQFADY